MATETTSAPQAGATALNTVKTMIGGSWVDGAGAIKEVRNPGTGDVVTNLPFSSSTQIDEAVAAAKAAQREWAKVPLAERADLLHKAVDAIGENAEEICLWTATEMGKTLEEAREEVVDWITIPVSRWAIEAGRHLEGAAPTSLENPDRRVTKILQPIGVAGFISPWNFPVEMLINCTAALVMGNACVWKPSEWAPTGPAIAARVFAEALPDGLMNVIWGGPEEGEQLVTHDDVGQITFIGSTAVGERISNVAGVKPLLLELGGNGPLIVMDDADLDRAVEATMDNCFFQAGQVCTAGERLLVHEDVHDEFAARIVAGAKALKVGNQLDDSTDMGPLSDKRILDKVVAHVEDARQAGADILTGGESDGLFYQPTVITGVTPDMRVAREETFGPVCPIIKIKSAEEALEIANDSEYGLSMSVFTSSLSTAYMLGEGLESGVVAVNAGTNQVDNAAGFGGWKSSGLGRECGEDNLREYVRIKNLSFDVS
jgi:acyl-CoA reductase-like NAD-dependent aldehyde dehydrogenase